MKTTKKIAILASGGNSPGMNNVLISFVKKCLSVGYQPIGILDGYRGIIEKSFFDLDVRKLEEFANRGNITINSSRYPEFKKSEVQDQAIKNLRNQGIDTLVTIGGDGTYQGAYALSKKGFNCIGIPGTIDNDVSSTDYSIGFDTCLNTIVHEVDHLIDTFGSHDGIVLVEAMGRLWPDLTLFSGIGLNVDHIVTISNILTIQEFVKIAQHAKFLKKRCCVFLITEKMYGLNNLPSLDEIAKTIEKETGCLTRKCVIGYVQRGGSPSAIDRYLANIMANYAVDLIIAKKFDKSVGIRKNVLTATDLSKSIKPKKIENNSKIIKIFNGLNHF